MDQEPAVDSSKPFRMSAESSSGTAPASSSNGNSGDTSRESEMIGSLGEALAGVNLGPNVHSNGFSFHSDHNSGTPYALNVQANDLLLMFSTSFD